MFTHASRRFGAAAVLSVLCTTVGCLGRGPVSSLPPEGPRADVADATPEAETGAIGVAVGRVDHAWMVLEVVEGSPAAKAHLHRGDVIFEVDGKETRTLKLKEVVELIKGPPGTKVRLLISPRDVSGRLTSAETRVVERTLLPEIPAPSAPEPLAESVRIELEDAPTEPLFVTTARQPSADELSADCLGAAMSPRPEVILELKRPTALTLEQVPNDHRVQMGVSVNGSKRLACSDRYGRIHLRRVSGPIRVHFSLPRGETERAALLVTGDGSPRDPLLLSPLAKDEQPSLGARDVRRHFPFLGFGRNLRFYEPPSPTVRQQLFLRAPRSLFVVPKFDLRKSDVRGSLRERLPAKGEALLLERSNDQRQPYVYTALGDRFTVYADALEPAPSSGALVVPPAGASWPAPSPDIPDLPTDAIEQAKKDYDACFNAAGDATHARIEAMHRSGQRVTRRREDAIWDAADAQAEQRCGRAALDRKIEATKKKRAAAELARRSALLEKIRQRLAL